MSLCKKVFMGVLLINSLFLLSCSVTIRDATPQAQAKGFLTVNCPESIRTKGYYCREERAYSGLVQSGSRVRVESLSTGKSITIAVYRRDNFDGVCVPERFRNLLGAEPFPARLEIQRCGVDDKRSCQAYIRGLASYYADPYHGRETPYGIKYDMHGYYAAHTELPLGTLLKVRNLKNNREVVVKVIDRGPFVAGRVLDLSYRAALELDMMRDGVVEVEAKVLRCGD
ncbi:MAG: septal ring lytic transglycosylase RlpA family protein [Aquificaceae bacterium]|nr:septal ring lytic transglycosylase RlpA family protein [Aquificaceae bacterium]